MSVEKWLSSEENEEENEEEEGECEEGVTKE